MQAKLNDLLPLGAVLLLYGIVASLFAVQVPAWQAPDEPAHYNYVRQLANGRFPVIEPGDYDQAYLDEIRGARFAPGYTVDSINYEDWQPPLYYLLLTPVFWLTNGSLLALRLTSVLIGAGVISLAYFTARELFAHYRWLPLTTAVFIAFLPQHVSILASVNNDSLAGLIIAALLFTMFAWTRQPLAAGRRNRTYLVGIGVLLGLGFLTKLTVYLMVPVTAVMLLGVYWGKWDRLVRGGILMYAPAGLIGFIWWARNLLVYEGIDPFAMAAHDAVVVGQPRTAEWVAELGRTEVIGRFLQTTFNSFWGQFGWMAVPMPTRVYQLLYLFTAVILLGLLLRLLARRIPTFRLTLINRNPYTRLRILTLLTLLLLTMSMHVYYNLTFVQHQGRYLFPALIPIGIGVGLSLEVWQQLVTRARLADLRPYLAPLIPVALGTVFALLNIVALFQYILPQLS